jgi:predicted dehydrogenase
VEVDDDTFVALEHAGGARSHLWASAVASRPGPRFRVLGSRAGYVVWGMDPQEQALMDGRLPSGGGWGQSPVSRDSTLGVGDDVAPVPIEAGHYGRFYDGIAASIRQGVPPPVTPAEALGTLDVIDAARRSASTGRPVDVSS